MFTHILGILLGYGFLVVLAWWLPNYLAAGKLGDPPWGIRLPVIRDQLVTVIALAAVSKLLFAFGLVFLGKLVVGAISALTLYFIWEDVRTWIRPPLSEETTRTINLIVYVAMLCSLFSMFI